MHYSYTRGLWRLALLFLLVGGGITYWLSLDAVTPEARTTFLLSLAVTVLVTGVTAICASAPWWFRR